MRKSFALLSLLVAGILSQSGALASASSEGYETISQIVAETSLFNADNGWNNVADIISTAEKGSIVVDSILSSVVFDKLDPKDSEYREKQMARIAVVCASNGPMEIKSDGFPEVEESVKEFLSYALKMRSEHPAMWRGTATIKHQKVGDAQVLIVDKLDEKTSDRILILFSDKTTTVPLIGMKQAVDVDAIRPEIVPVKSR